MKNHRNFLTVSALSVLLMAGTGGAIACDMGKHMGMGGHHEGPMGGMGEEHFLERIYDLQDLSPDQRKQLNALRDKVRARMDEARLDRRALHDAMRDKASPEQLKPLAEKQGQDLTAMILLHAETRAALAQILTKEQQATLAKNWHGKQGHHPADEGDANK